MKYYITKHRNFKNNTEKMCYAYLLSDVQANSEIPVMFDDGQNKVPVIARNIQNQMEVLRQKSQRGLVSKSHIKIIIADDQSKADFYNNADDEPFITLSKA
jgi:hypothetical protein